MLRRGKARDGERYPWQCEVAASRASDRHKADGELKTMPLEWRGLMQSENLSVIQFFCQILGRQKN